LYEEERQTEKKNVNQLSTNSDQVHSSTRMLVRYTHPTEERKAEPLGSFSHSTRHNGVTIARSAE
jgi:hypothetical protein